MAQRRIRVKKRVCVIRRIRALDGSAFFKWYAFNSMFLFFFLSFFVFYIFVLILNMIKLNVYVCMYVVELVVCPLLLHWLWLQQHSIQKVTRHCSQANSPKHSKFDEEPTHFALSPFYVTFLTLTQFHI